MYEFQVEIFNCLVVDIRPEPSITGHKNATCLFLSQFQTFKVLQKTKLYQIVIKLNNEIDHCTCYIITGN